MNLPDGISERELIDHLFARVETIEGIIRAYRSMLPPLIGELTPSQRKHFAENWAQALSDVMAEVRVPGGQYLRGSATLARTQENGLQGEVDRLQALLNDYAPPAR